MKEGKRADGDWGSSESLSLFVMPLKERRERGQLPSESPQLQGEQSLPELYHPHDMNLSTP